MNGPCLGVITLDARGGGVAAVSRLLWRVFRESWPDSTLYELARGGRTGRMDSSTADRLRFGVKLAMRQAAGGPGWMCYSHLAVAQVQSFVPPPIKQPYAVFLHGIEVWRPLSRAQMRVLAGARLRLSNSRFTAERVQTLHPEIGPVVPCALALENDSDSRSFADRHDVGQHAVLIVGRMLAAERYKGHDQLLEAWPDIRSRVPDATLVCVGEGDDIARLQMKAAALGLSECVSFPGFVSNDDVLRFYRGAKVFAMPSRSEGFGLVYLEAMSHHLPCIGSIHDAAPEVIDDGVTGFLIDQVDRPALVDCVVRLLTDEALRTGMGGAGAARVRSMFTYEHFSARLRPHLDTTFGGARYAPLPVASSR